MSYTTRRRSYTQFRRKVHLVIQRGVFRLSKKGTNLHVDNCIGGLSVLAVNPFSEWNVSCNPFSRSASHTKHYLVRVILEQTRSRRIMKYEGDLNHLKESSIQTTLLSS